MSDIAGAITKNANKFRVTEKQKKVMKISSIVLGGAVVGALAIYGIVALVLKKKQTSSKSSPQ